MLRSGGLGSRNLLQSLVAAVVVLPRLSRGMVRGCRVSRHLWAIENCHGVMHAGGVLEAWCTVMAPAKAWGSHTMHPPHLIVVAAHATTARRDRSTARPSCSTRAAWTRATRMQMEMDRGHAMSLGQLHACWKVSAGQEQSCALGGHGRRFAWAVGLLVLPQVVVVLLHVADVRARQMHRRSVLLCSCFANEA